MNKLLLLLPFVAIVGCSPDRILLDELTNKVIDGDKLHYFNGDLFTGSAFDIYSNGKLEKEINFKEGKPNGLVKHWDENGQLDLEQNVIDGKADGLCKSWYENGQLEYQENYKDGKQEGLYQSWHKNGQLKCKWNYKQGELDGLQQSWDENGQLTLETKFKNGIYINRNLNSVSRPMK